MDFFSQYTAYPHNQVLRADKNLALLIELALLEDGKDLSAEGIFDPAEISKVSIITKENSFVVGLPLIPYIIDTLFTLQEVYTYANDKNNYTYTPLVKEASYAEKGTILCTIEAPTILILKVERVILNFISHLSGIANFTNKYVQALEGTNVTLLDTRKTLPAHRYLEKYATLCGGAKNHRLALDDMIMLKDNHIDAIGSIKEAVNKIRKAYKDCPPIEIECRTIEEVKEAVLIKPERIMLDNMTYDMLKIALALIPKEIEAEVSGNVSLENIRIIADIYKERRPDFISVGKLTHSAPSADFSMKAYKDK